DFYVALVTTIFSVAAVVSAGSSVRTRHPRRPGHAAARRRRGAVPPPARTVLLRPGDLLPGPARRRGPVRRRPPPARRPAGRPGRADPPQLPAAGHRVLRG